MFMTFWHFREGVYYGSDCTAHVFICIRIASNSGPPGNNYFILLILTDGIITDMPQTCEAIVNVRLIIINSIDNKMLCYHMEDHVVPL